MSDNLWFERLAELTGDVTPERVPARLTSKTYSALWPEWPNRGRCSISQQRKKPAHGCASSSTPLTVLPLGYDVRSMNPCRVCHARVLAERMEQALHTLAGLPLL
jgi:hypothetical protein